MPVHVGSRVAFGNWAPNEDDGKYIHGTDGLGDVPPLDGEADLGTCEHDLDESLSSAEFIAQTARERPGEVTVVSAVVVILALGEDNGERGSGEGGGTLGGNGLAAPTEVNVTLDISAGPVRGNGSCAADFLAELSNAALADALRDGAVRDGYP